MRGTVGRSYKLHLVTPAGTKVESTDEMMLPVGDMDSLYYQYEEAEPQRGRQRQGSGCLWMAKD